MKMSKLEVQIDPWGEIVGHFHFSPPLQLQYMIRGMYVLCYVLTLHDN